MISELKYRLEQCSPFETAMYTGTKVIWEIMVGDLHQLYMPVPS